MRDDLVNDWVRSLDDTEDRDATPEEETMISIILSQRKRIEELEAKLAKAVKLIELCREMQAQVAHREDPLMVLIDTTLADIEGAQP